jgi:arylformamidase
MCDAVSERGKGWRGWIELPKADVPRPIGGWVDCSWPVSKDMPRVALFPEPTIRLVKSLPVDPINVTEIGMVVHIGVVWRFDKQEHDLIEIADLERATPAMRPGDIVAIDTGFAARFGTSAYERHPSLSHDAAKWLVAKKAKLVACDFGTPDLPLHRRGKDFNWPVHLELLSHGVLICEHLAGHTALAGRRVEFVISALNIRSSDGAPARIMAREIAD